MGRSMVRWLGCATFVLLFVACNNEPQSIAVGDLVPTVEYANACWYQDGEFQRRSAFVRDGEFVATPALAANHVVDLGGKYVVPGFAEGHHHMVLCNPEVIEQFIDAGIVYAGIMNARVSSRMCQSEMHPLDGLELVNTLAGITAREAHPYQIGLYFLEPNEIDGEWVHYVDSKLELDAVWPRISETAPDLVKIFLSYTENYHELREDKTMASWYRGLDPALAAPIVSKAHAAGLLVAAHVMSAHDFKLAVESGVEIIAHMPGFAPGSVFTEDDPHPWLAELDAQPERYTISEDVAAEAAKREVAVITTVSADDPTPAIRANFRILQDAGVTLLIGSDRGEFNAVDEAVFLVENGLMTAPKVLHSIAVTTPQRLFPGRDIGGLKEGAEATFVVLKSDPLQDFSAIRQVEHVVKRGTVLRPAD